MDRTRRSSSTNDRSLSATPDPTHRSFVWLYAALAGVFPISLASGGHTDAHAAQGDYPVAAVLAALAVLAVVPLAYRLAVPEAGFSVESAFRFSLALLSTGAAAIHFVVTPHHLDEYRLFGVFFVAAALAQIAWAVLVVVSPSGTLLALGALGNLAIVLLWLYTRVVGLPFGPDAGQIEVAGAADVIASTFESLILLGSVALLLRPITPRSVSRTAFRLAMGTALAAVAAVTAVGLVSGAAAT
jgi:hypothetical protein